MKRSTITNYCTLMLLGASLAVTSCSKDYDNDIRSLKEAIADAAADANGKFDDVNTSLDDHETRLTATKAELAVVVKQLEALDAAYKAADTQEAAARAEGDAALADSLEALADEVALESQRLTTTKEALEKSIAALEGDVATLKLAVTALQTTDAERKAQIENLIKEDATLADLIAALTVKVDDNKDDIDANTDLINKSVEDLMDLLDDANAAIAKNAEDLAANGTDIQANADAIEALKADMYDNGGLISTLEKTLNAAIVANTTLIKDNKTATDAEITALNNSVSAINIAIQDLKDKMTALDAAYKAADDALYAKVTTDIANSAAAVQNSIDACSDRLDSFETRLGSLEGSYATLVGNDATLTALYNALNNYIVTDLKDFIDATNDTLADHESRIAEIEATILVHGTRIDALETGLQASIDDFNSFIDGDFNALTVRVSDLETGLAALEELVNGKISDDIAANADAIAANYAELLALIQSNDVDIAGIIASIDELKSVDLVSLQTQITDLVTKRDSDNKFVWEMLAKLFAADTEINGEIENIKNDYLLKADYDADIAAYKAELETKFEGIATQIKDLNNALTALETTVTENSADIVANAEDIADANEQIEALILRVNYIQTQSVVYLQSQIDALDTKFSGAVDALQTALDTLKAQVDTNTSDITKLKSDLADLTTVVNTNSANINTNATNIATNATNIGLNSDAITAAQTDLDAAEQDIVNLTARVDALEDADKLTADEITAIKTDIATAKAKYDQAIVDLTAAIADLTARVDANDKDIASLKAFRDAINKLLIFGFEYEDPTTGTMVKVPAISTIVADNKAAIEDIETALDALQDQVDQNTADIETLLNRIQSIKFVPDYTNANLVPVIPINKAADGSFSEIKLTYRVSPVEAVQSVVDAFAAGTLRASFSTNQTSVTRATTKDFTLTAVAVEAGSDSYPSSSITVTAEVGSCPELNAGDLLTNYSVAFKLKSDDLSLSVTTDYTFVELSSDYVAPAGTNLDASLIFAVPTQDPANIDYSGNFPWTCNANYISDSFVVGKSNWSTRLATSFCNFASTAPEGFELVGNPSIKFLNFFRCNTAVPVSTTTISTSSTSAVNFAYYKSADQMSKITSGIATMPTFIELDTYYELTDAAKFCLSTTVMKEYTFVEYATALKIPVELKQTVKDIATGDLTDVVRAACIYIAPEVTPVP